MLKSILLPILPLCPVPELQCWFFGFGTDKLLLPSAIPSTSLQIWSIKCCLGSIFLLAFGWPECRVTMLLRTRVLLAENFNDQRRFLVPDTKDTRDPLLELFNNLRSAARRPQHLRHAPSLPQTTSVAPHNFLQTDFKRIKIVTRLLEFWNPLGLDEI